MAFTETAYAKINLALHVRRRREDGYHELETLFAFVDDGDRLTASPASRDALNVKGEFAGALDEPFGNIVAKALGKRLNDMGLLMIDGPISGGAAKAMSGEMTVMSSGTPAAYAKCEDVLDAIAGKTPEPFNFRKGLRIQTLVETIQTSSREGRWLDVK